MWLIPGLRGVVVFFLSTGSWFHRFDQPDKSPCQTRVSVRQAMSYWWLTIRPRRVLSLSRAFRCSVSPGDPWEDPFGRYVGTATFRGVANVQVSLWSRPAGLLGDLQKPFFFCILAGVRDAPS